MAIHEGNAQIYFDHKKAPSGKLMSTEVKSHEMTSATSDKTSIAFDDGQRDMASISSAGSYMPAISPLK